MMHLSAWMGGAQAAAGALVAAVWQGFLLAVVAWAGLKLVPKTPAAVRFAIWFAVFLVVAGLPVVSLLRPAGEVGGGHGAWLTLDARWCVAIAGVWIGVSLVRAGTLVVAAVRVRALWKRAEVYRPGNAEFKTDCVSVASNEQRATSDARRAVVCVSDEVDRPSVIGFFSPKILIPRWLIEKLTPEELRQVVLHESGHLGRADDWMNLVQKIALVVFPLNPALAWVERRLCFERELACDERVLAETGAPKAYAACLVGLAKYRLDRRSKISLAIGALGRESELGRRVRRILERGQSMRPLHARLVLGGAMLGLVFGGAELGRCPEIVGFRVQGSGSSLQASAQVNRAPGFGVQAVVFHPEANGVAVMQRRSKQRRALAKVGPMRDVEVVSALGFEEIVRPPEGRDDEAPQRTARFVMVTSWGSGGTRVVVTPERTTVSGPGDVSSIAVPDVDAGRDDTNAPPPQQVDPYAAVPVRGGWLVIQL